MGNSSTTLNAQQQYLVDLLAMKRIRHISCWNGKTWQPNGVLRVIVENGVCYCYIGRLELGTTATKHVPSARPQSYTFRSYLYSLGPPGQPNYLHIAFHGDDTMVLRGSDDQKRYIELRLNNSAIDGSFSGHLHIGTIDDDFNPKPALVV